MVSFCLSVENKICYKSATRQRYKSKLFAFKIIVTQKRTDVFFIWFKNICSEKPHSLKTILHVKETTYLFCIRPMFQKYELLSVTRKSYRWNFIILVFVVIFCLVIRSHLWVSEFVELTLLLVKLQIRSA